MSTVTLPGKRACPSRSGLYAEKARRALACRRFPSGRGDGKKRKCRETGLRFLPPAEVWRRVKSASWGSRVCLISRRARGKGMSTRTSSIPSWTRPAETRAPSHRVLRLPPALSKWLGGALQLPPGCLLCQGRVLLVAGPSRVSASEAVCACCRSRERKWLPRGRPWGWCRSARAQGGGPRACMPWGDRLL